MTVMLFFAFICLGGIMTSAAGRKAALSAFSAEQPVDEIQRSAAASFPASDKMQALCSRCARLFGQSAFDGVYYDADGGRLIDVHSGLDTEKAYAAAKAIDDFHAGAPELPAFVMLVPTASGIYRERLPESLAADDQQKLIDELYYAIDPEITPLDVYGSLFNVRENYIFYRTDDRWTPQGAYAAYAVSAQRLGAALYSVQNYDVEYTHVEFFGDLAERSGIRSIAPDRVNAYRCKFGSYVKSCDVTHDGITDNRTSVYSRSGLIKSDKYSFFLGSSELKTAHIVTTAEGMPKLLLIGSDYAHCFVPFLLPHYSEIMLIDPKQLADGETVDMFADTKDFDQVLFLFDLKTFCGESGYEKLSKR